MALMHEHHCEFRAMGSECAVRVVVDDSVDGDALTHEAVTLIASLEQRWSRFRDDSELAQLNRHSGAPVFVSAETIDILSIAFDAWRATSGLFDPTMHDAMNEVGYTDSFDSWHGSHGGLDGEQPARGMREIEIDAGIRMVRTPPGVHLDLGGIGKGRAADLVATRLRDLGAIGVCVDLGGDVRVSGAAVDGGGWAIAIDDPFSPGADLAVVALSEGSVTTSSRLRRHWNTSDGPAHHLLDPTTGRPAFTGLAAVTVLAADASWGECHAKAALLAGPDDGARLLEDAGLSGVLVSDDATVRVAGSFDQFRV